MAQTDSAYFYFNKSTPLKLFDLKIKETSKHKNYYRLIYHSRLRNPDSMSYYIALLNNDKKLTNFQKCRTLYFSGFYNKITNNDSLFFKQSHQAYRKAEEIKDSLTVLYSLSALAQTYDYSNDNHYNLEYLNLLKNKAQLYKNPNFKIIHRFLLGNYYFYRDENKKALSNFKTLLNYKYSKSDSTYLLYTLNNLGALFEDNLLQSDSAIYYYNKKLDVFKKSPYLASKEAYFNTYFNIANSYKRQNNLKQAEIYYLKADSVPSRGNRIRNKKIINEDLSDLYAQQKDYEKAYNSLHAYIMFSDSLNVEDHREAIANIKEQYDNEKLRADNLEIEAKRKQNRNLLLASLLFLLFGGISAYLIHKNTKRKQKLAEQEKEIESQKLSTVLKEQELTAIDAMIEGQEKERQRIANDLHDDLGGLMTTVKWHFNSFQEKQTPELFEKTNNLLEAAYQKIRTIAHAKNSGVIAKQGLLKAIKNMASTVSVSNKLKIEVIDFGLETRLENSLELSIFRIIQELLTNVIKHAYATEVNIHITNHEDTLNIMVEDNGIGFNPSQITKTNKGMGISSIDKRVEHLNGSMKIESEANKGTTVIIDIPL